MPTWTFYRLADGAVLRQQFTGPERALAANTPAGCGAIAGSFSDGAALRVVEGRAVPWQPPAPAATAAREWRWDAAAQRWQPAPTLQALRAQAAARLRRLMEQREAQQGRRVREMLLALASGADTVAAAAGLQRINDDIEALRGKLASVPGADRETLLAMLETTP